jgi:aminoglycoside 3-N-acetyltransferase
VHEAGGQVLLLGVQHSESTSLHLAEAIAGVPYSIEHPCVVMLDGVAQRVLIAESDHCCRGFTKLDGWLRERALQREGSIGSAHARLCDARELVSLAVARLRADPLVFLCPVDAECDECPLARASIKA